MGRQRNSTQKPYNAKDALERLVNKAKSLTIRGYLYKSEENKLKAAFTILRTEPNSWKGERYGLFLRSLQKNCGPHGVLLCAVALSQVIIANMNQQSRDDLASIFNSDSRLSTKEIRELATEFNIPGTPRRM